MAIICVIGLLWPKQTLLPLNSFDQPFYLGIAQDIVQTGRFTNGFAFDEVPAGTLRDSGMRFGPLYPATLAAVSWVDRGLRAGMACLAATNGHNPSCPDSAPVMRGLQCAELAGFFLLVWWIGLAAGGSLGMAWLTLGLALVTTPLLLRSVDTLMTEISSLFFVTAAIAAGIAAVRAPTWRGAGGWGLAAGVLLGLTALTRPGFLYLLPFALLGAVYLCLRKHTARWIVSGLTMGGVVTISPWIARNAIMFGRPALTFGYDSHTLVQRIAFDTMSWHEYALSYLCWLPDGTSLGRNMIGPGACDRFGWDNDPNSFYSLGLRHMLDQTLAAAGGYEHHMRYLLFHFIFRKPVWHALVSIPLALRGAYVAHWWGFCLLAPCLIWTWVELRRGHAALLIVALPAWFMLALNAAVAVNQVRYNLMLIPAYALAGAFSLRWLMDAARRSVAPMTSRSRDGARGQFSHCAGRRRYVISSCVSRVRFRPHYVSIMVQPVMPDLTVMRCLIRVFPLTVATLLIIGAHLAVAGSVYTPPPMHFTVHHSYANGKAPRQGFVGGFFGGLATIGGEYDGPPRDAMEASAGDTQRMAGGQPSAIASDAERYRAATGKALPASHGTIVLPPTTPGGDETYIWGTSDN